MNCRFAMPLAPKTYCLGLPLAIVCMSVTATAAVPATDKPVKEPTSIASGPVRSAFSASGVGLLAGNDGSTIFIQTSPLVKSLIPSDPDACSPKGYACFTRWTLKAEAPLGKGSKEGTLLTPDGLGTDTSFSLAYSRYLQAWRFQTQSQLARYNDLCGELERSLKEKNLLRKAAGLPELETDCSEPAMKEHLPQVHAEFLTVLPGTESGGLLWGLEARSGVKDAEYLDVQTLGMKKQRDHPWSVSAQLGWSPALHPEWFALVKLDHRQEFKAQDTGTVCQLGASPTDPPTCASGPLGAPGLVRKTVATLELRRQLSDNYAAAISLTRDFSKHVTAVAVPLYLVANDKGRPTAGIRLNWQSDKRGVNWSVFVSTPFNLLP